MSSHIYTVPFPKRLGCCAKCKINIKKNGIGFQLLNSLGRHMTKKMEEVANKSDTMSDSYICILSFVICKSAVCLLPVQNQLVTGGNTQIC